MNKFSGLNRVLACIYGFSSSSGKNRTRLQLKIQVAWLKWHPDLVFVKRRIVPFKYATDLNTYKVILKFEMVIIFIAFKVNKLVKFFANMHFSGNEFTVFYINMALVKEKSQRVMWFSEKRSTVAVQRNLERNIREPSPGY